MNQMNVPFGYSPPPPEEAADAIDLGRLWAIVRRQLPVVAIGALVGLALGIAYLVTTPRTFTAIGLVMVEDGQGRLVEEASPAPAAQRTDAMLLSEIEILRSARMAETVARDLSLFENEGFMNPPRSGASILVGGVVDSVRGLLGTVKGLAGDVTAEPARTAPLSEEEREAARVQIAAQRLGAGLVVQRSGRSYAIQIGYRSHSAQLSQAIADAYMRAYLADGLQTSFETTKRAAGWMQARLEELGRDTREASLEAERFRAANGLASTRGLLVPEQQLSDLNGQLALARGETAKARAQLAQAESVVGRPPDQAIAAAGFVDEGEPVNPVLSELRTTYLSLAVRERGIAASFAPSHPQAVALRREMDELSTRIMKELATTVASLRNALETAEAREAALQQSVSRAAGQNAEASEAQVELRELEQRAETFGNLYQTFLGRFAEVQKQQSFPVAKVRVLSEARLPRAKSGPSTTKVLGALIVLGAMAGAGVGAVRELRERFLRTEDDVRHALGARFLGYVPEIEVKRLSTGGGGETDDGSGDPSLGWVPDDVAAARMLSTLSAPASMLAETLRTVRIAADVTGVRDDGRVIGVASVLPGEGKSTIAGNLAAQIAAGGVPVLLVDADLRKPTVTRALVPHAEHGLMDSVLAGKGWADFSRRVEGTNLIVAPSVMTGRVVHTSEFLSSAAMAVFLADARQRFAYIIVDLPPLAPVSDAKAMAHLIDAFLLVARWGDTPRALVRNQLRGEPAILDRLLGVVLNRVDMKALRRYDDEGGQAHFSARYGDYQSDASVALVNA